MRGRMSTSREGFGRGWLVVAALVVGLRGGASADARGDLADTTREVANVTSHYNTAKQKLEDYLAVSVRLRAFDKDQLDELVRQICRLDIKRDGDNPTRVAEDMRDKSVERVKSSYNDAVNAGSNLFDDVGRLEYEAKTAREHARRLEDQPEVKSDAERLRQEIEKTQEAIVKLFERLASDRSTLDRVKDGVMNGSNNPTIRARMEWGKLQHVAMQSSRSCDEKEVALSSGRPDCIKFDQDDCKVIEFKPDTYKTGDAKDQAERYLRDVRDRFKNDDRAKKCKQNADGPIFEAVGETYPACKVP